MSLLPSGKQRVEKLDEFLKPYLLCTDTRLKAWKSPAKRLGNGLGSKICSWWC